MLYSPHEATKEIAERPRNLVRRDFGSATKMGARDSTRCTTRANRCSNDQKTKKSEDVNGGGVKYQVAGVTHVVDLLVLWIVLLKFDEGVANLDVVVLV